MNLHHPFEYSNHWIIIESVKEKFMEGGNLVSLSGHCIEAVYIYCSIFETIWGLWFKIWLWLIIKLIILRTDQTHLPANHGSPPTSKAQVVSCWIALSGRGFRTGLQLLHLRLVFLILQESKQLRDILLQCFTAIWYTLSTSRSAYFSCLTSSGSVFVRLHLELPFIRMEARPFSTNTSYHILSSSCSLVLKGLWKLDQHLH